MSFLSNAAEHYVVAELLRREIHAAQAPRNAPEVDILASAGPRAARIRVKAGGEERAAWVWTAKRDGAIFANISEQADFAVLVHLRGPDAPPRYWVVPTAQLDHEVRRRHEEWKKAPGRGGRAHDPTTRIRTFGANEGEPQWLEQFAGCWDLILAALGRAKEG